MVSRVTMKRQDHPHPSNEHLIQAMRRYLLGVKHKIGSARGLGHYHGLLQTYLTAKRDGPLAIPYKRDRQPSSIVPYWRNWVCDDSFQDKPQGCEIGRFVVRSIVCRLCKREGR